MDQNNDKKRNSRLVSVVIPVFNEEATVGDIVTRTKKTLEEMQVTYEILVVDDGSTDNSAQIAKKLGAHVIREKHQGKGYTLRTGFNNISGELLVTLDADGSHKPEELPLVLQPLRKNRADFVIGSRFLNSEANKAKVPRLNRVGNKLFNDLIGALTGTPISDSQSGFRAIKSSLVNEMNLHSNGYEVESEMLIKALRMRARVMETPISFIQRTVGSSKLDPIQDGIRIFYAVIASYLS